VNFGSLKARLLAQIGRAPSDLCYELVTAEINEGLRVPQMQAVVTFAPVGEYTLPSDFLEAVSVYHEVSGGRLALEAQEPTTFDASWVAASWPQFYSISDGVMRVYGTEGGGTISLRYYQRQADMVADSDSNAILEDHPSVYVYGVLAHHAALVRDAEALQVHFPAYERAVAKAQPAGIARRNGGNMAGPTPRVAP